ncbi:MAG TPA: periplasmic heavy metal sensor [Gammaproteobacteria bacterium]|nr:periplasmic heavy metal sensor [Gammaproteobacteria bacterium]
MNIRQGFLRTSLLSAAVVGMFALGLASSPVWAHEHHDKHDKGCEHHHHGYMIKPHNAAMHLLMMAHAIDLTHEQVGKLMKMRNDYIKNNAVAEDMLKVEHKDLKWLLYADDFDKKAVKNKLEEIGKLRDQLWDAYVDQRAQISSLLTQEQKDKIEEMYHHGHEMERGKEHGDHGMGDMDKHERRDHGGMGRSPTED